MHLSTEEPAASWMLELFEEIGGDIPEYFLFGYVFFSINDAVKKLSLENSSKTLQLEFRRRILKFDTKLDSGELHCVTKTATYRLLVPIFVNFSFSPMKVSVTDFSVPIGASIFKFCV